MEQQTSRTRELTEDLIHEILLRADVKLLLRCKILSKPYYDLITSPSFVSKHLHQSTISRNKNIDNIAAIVNVSPKKLVRGNIVYIRPAQTNKTTAYLLSSESKLYVPPLLVPGSIFILGSCNGLLFVRGLNENHHYVFYLCNPSTREYMTITHPRHSIGDDLGFGHDVSSGQYKVVSIFKNYNRRFERHVQFDQVEVAVDVWSSRTNRWIWVESNLTDILKGYKLVRAGVFVKGNLFWLADNKERQIVLCFRLAHDTIGEVSTSDVASQYARCRMDMTELRDSLLLFVQDVSSPDSSLGWHDIWVMKNDGCRTYWTKHLKIRPDISQFPEARVCENWKFGTLVGSKFSLHGPPSREIMQLFLPGSKFELWSFVRSLVSVKQSSDDGGYEDV